MNGSVVNLKDKSALILLGGGTVVLFSYFLARVVYENLWATAYWFDTIPHFVAGATAASGAVWLLAVFRPNAKYSASVIVGVFLFALAIGILWEFIEYFGGAFREPNLVLDTTVDLIMDMVGAAVFVSFIRNQHKKK